MLILIKIAGCFIYYWFYFIYKPHNAEGDSYDTLQAAEIMYKAFSHNKEDFFKMIFGLHSDLITDPLYEPYFKNIDDWGESDSTNEFFLNDNRTSIRLHAFIMLFSNGYYATHALVMLIVSFIGQFAFYKSFKQFFFGKEKLLVLIIFITPSVLFWTSGILKEPLAIGLMGLFIYGFLKLFYEKNRKLKFVILLLLSGSFFIILKPYILALLICPLIVFAICHRFNIKRVGLFYLLSLTIVYVSTLVALKFIFQKDVIKTIVVRQNDFISLSRGGVFFVNENNYLRLDYNDNDKFKIIDSSKSICRIDPRIKLMYWDLNHLRDTIFVSNNQDTSLYTLIATNKPAGSGILMDRLQYSFSSFVKLLPVSFYNVLCRPFFYDAHSVAELIASLENLFFGLFFILCFMYRKKNSINKTILWFCLAMVVLSFFLIGFTTTVAGAIVRYKVPFISFLLMIPLLYLDEACLKKIPFIKRLVN